MSEVATARAVGTFAADLAEARERVYRGMELISLPGGHYRGDIALAAAEGRVTLSTTAEEQA